MTSASVKRFDRAGPRAKDSEIQTAASPNRKKSTRNKEATRLALRQSRKKRNATPKTIRPKSRESKRGRRISEKLSSATLIENRCSTGWIERSEERRVGKECR